MQRGPFGWRNAAAHDRGQPPGERIEAMLYGDVHVSGELVGALGPYELLNALNFDRPPPHPVLVLRATFHLTREEDETGDPTVLQTDHSTFHGGDVFDELAALVSLALGIRCQSGGSTRHWFLYSDLDGFGHPTEFDHRPPSLAPPRRGPVLPTLSRAADVGEASDLLATYLALEPGGAVALVRASRLYEQAIWIADADPHQAWLWLVSALEVAAGQWNGNLGSPSEIFRAGWPELSTLLEAQGGSLHVEAAKLIAPRIRATKRFINFVMEFLPDPPPTRGYEWAQVDWADMPEHLHAIYDYRSRALHDGTPFPAPMCEAPRSYDKEGLTERPDGLATSARDARWVASDTPMLLWLFEYVTRHALRSWWSHLPVSST